MAYARLIDDGDFTTTTAFKHDIRFPFSDRNDFVSFEYVVSYQVDKNHFVSLPSMSAQSTPRGTAYFVEQGDVRDVGDNLVEFDRVFASIPRNRIESASIVYTQQWWAVSGDPEIVEASYTLNGRIVYEYFTYVPPALIRPRVILVSNTYLFVGTPVQSSNALVIAEDSDVRIYKAGIYQRATSYVYTK